MPRYLDDHMLVKGKSDVLALQVVVSRRKMSVMYPKSVQNEGGVEPTFDFILTL